MSNDKPKQVWTQQGTHELWVAKVPPMFIMRVFRVDSGYTYTVAIKGNLEQLLSRTAYGTPEIAQLWAEVSTLGYINDKIGEFEDLRKKLMT